MRKEGFVVVSASLVMLASLVGVIHGVRASIAQRLYYEVRYGAARNDTERILSYSERALELYPWNYLLCSVATDSAFVRADNETKVPMKSRLFSSARRWCECGLELNSYSRELNLRRAGLFGVEVGGAAKAAACWERYTDWHYWSPENHALLGRMYAWAGDFEKAEECARLIAKFAEYAVLRQTIDAEKAGVSGRR